MRKRRFVTVICALAAALSLNVVPASANTTDREYGYYAVGSGYWHVTNEYAKENTSKVYVKPTQSPSGKTYVQTYCRVRGNNTNKTSAGTVTLYNGSAYGITNRVYEDGDRSGGVVYMWLELKTTSGVGWTKGWWSPDWSGVTPVTIV